jgi:hypothetical protein
MEIYKVKTKEHKEIKDYPTGQVIWTTQLPEADSGDEILGSEQLSAELLDELSSVDKSFIILELLQMIRQENVEVRAKEVARRTEKLKLKSKKKA